MDFDVLDSLDDLGVPDSFHDELEEAIKSGSESIRFTQVIEWFSKELQALCDLESCVHSITDIKDYKSFLLDVSTFLKELRCPYKCLLAGDATERLMDKESRLILLDYLCTELQAARLVTNKTKKTNAFDIEMDESSSATSLTNAMKVLDIELESTENDDVLPKIVSEVKNLLSSNPNILSAPAMTDDLTQEQWDALHNLYDGFLKEYTLRRELLLTRLDVTLPSFQWGEERKTKGRQILSIYKPKREKLNKKPSVKISDVIAAREDLFVIEKTSSAELVKNTKSSVKKILIPEVPDRGGRPKEQRPAAEMPRWGERSQGGGRGDHGGGYQHRGKRGRGRRGY